MFFQQTTIITLSHSLSPSTPGYGGKSCFQQETTKSLARGDSANGLKWTLANHSGSHVDVPLHFMNQGRSLTDFAPSDWFFSRPFLVDVKAQPDQILTEEVLKSVPQDAEAVLVRTGFESHRGDAVYWENNPGWAPSAGAWLRAYRPRVRLIGFDFISLSAYQHRELGREAHRVFLKDGEGAQPILIGEDLKLSALQKSPEWMIVAPLLVQGADGAPVTIFAGLSL